MNRLIPLLLVLFAACAHAPAAAPAISAEQQFRDLETKLLAMQTLDVRFDITSGGAMASAVKGALHIDGDEVKLDADGHVGESKQDARVSRSGHPAVRRAVILGMIRMGILHNLASVMLMNQGIDTRVASGDWVTVGNVAADPADGHLSFDVLVEGQKAGAGELWLGAGGLPKRRHQTVQFPNGTLIVDERYQWP